MWKKATVMRASARDQVQQIRLLHNATSLVEVPGIEDESGDDEDHRQKAGSTQNRIFSRR